MSDKIELELGETWIDEYLILKTGRKIYCCSKTIGIDPSLSYITYGSDGCITHLEDEDMFENEDNLSKQELHEIADVMIKRWTKFKETVG